jgi:hypothetical protein
MEQLVSVAYEQVYVARDTRMGIAPKSHPCLISKDYMIEL